jgi:hypothetical protein
MDSREEVYLEKYIAAHNERLRHHPQYREDMSFHFGSCRGDLVLQTRDRRMSEDDAVVFAEVLRSVAATHKFIPA